LKETNWAKWIFPLLPGSDLLMGYFQGIAYFPKKINTFPSHPKEHISNEKNISPHFMRIELFFYSDKSSGTDRE
jgi:hypothetical protein